VKIHFNNLSWLVKSLGLTLLFLLNACEAPFNYEERGIASYYNDALEGRPTASGIIFSQDSLSAAHKTLPFGTKVLVTNLQNQRKIWVTINDRGPFIGERIIDLSKRAADSLGILQVGISSVLIEAFIE
jgi:rare lipoprotein A